FNYKRKNRWKDKMSPYDILIRDTKTINPSILNLPPPILEDFYSLFRNEYSIGGGYLVGNAVTFFHQFYLITYL
ncbi:TPA: hypothetical protein DCX16_01440, partial [bacterium]|nr:hypothetical protein [bacterium]